MTEEDAHALRGAITAAATHYEADIYFYSGSIDDKGIGQLATEVTSHQEREKAILILTTNGGSANAAYQIARLLQDQYDEWWMFCPSRCKSAGTLVALGANGLIMDVFSELGPLDVQLIAQNEIALRKSGLLAKSSFDALADAAFQLYERLMVNITVKSRGNVSFKMASELSASMASTLLAPVYNQINPEVVGSENRDLSIAFEYGTRLVADAKNAKKDAVERLVYAYPSHDFVIDAAEAKQLFRKVETPSDDLYRIVGTLGNAAYNESPSTIVCALHPLGIQERDDDAGTPEKPGAEEVATTVDDRGNADRSGYSEPAGGSDSGRAAASSENLATGTDGGAVAGGSAEVHELRPKTS